jgi:uracil-DNA glycosylase family 4
MHTALDILTDELRRLKAAGIKSVSVSEESLVALRRAVRAGSSENRQPLADAERPTPTPARVPVAPVTFAKTPEPSPVAVRQPVAVVAFPAAPVIVLPPGDKATRWNALRELVRNDARCRSQVRPGKQVVLGVGNLDAKIMFVGEAPGAEEEVQGEPFVGPAGQLLTKMIGGMGLARGDVYIGNIMNWRPDLPTAAGGTQVGNRPPTEEEMRYCLPYLRAQIEIVQPSLLVALGSTAAQGLLGFGSFKTLGEIRGQWREFGGTPLLVTYHPSYILRSQSNRSKRMIWEDLLKVMERAGLPISEKQRGYFLER